MQSHCWLAGTPACLQVPARCYDEYGRLLCQQLPHLEKYYTGIAKRCANVTLGCAADDGTSANANAAAGQGLPGVAGGGGNLSLLAATGQALVSVPVVASKTGAAARLHMQRR